ncbi:MAG TPA: lipocalin-like domain-containing protein [Opitutaceae bacterium]
MHRLFSILTTGVLIVALAASMSAQESAPLQRLTADGFAVPQPGYAFSFPRDHGAHPDFRIEWWYVTGHLRARDNRRFGVQATFFRNAAPDQSSDLHLAHVALLDVATGTFLHQERLNRTGWDATASADGLDVRNGPWSLRMTDPASERMELRGGIRAEAAFTLDLAPGKPLVRFGENGLSRKGADPTSASYYLTFPRIAATGSLTVGAETLEVAGELWMDHEISSSQLSEGQVGWDWISVHLNDGREVMLYRLRRRDGSADPASILTWVDAQGKPQVAPFTWAVESTWTSARTGAVYPARVKVTTTDPATGRGVDFTVEPLAASQELTGELGGVPYWEGACRVLDASGREIGSAFMELTGYAKELKI